MRLQGGKPIADASFSEDVAWVSWLALNLVAQAPDIPFDTIWAGVGVVGPYVVEDDVGG